MREVWQGTKRTKTTARTAKAAILIADVIAMTSSQTDAMISMRDRALLLVGFAGGFRRGELLALEVSDLVDRI